MKILYFIICSMILLHCLSRQSNACTAFYINHSGDVYIGKNFDWILGDGLFFVNKRDMSKQAVPTFFDKKDSWGQLVSWVSKYGSVTFNIFGREFGFAGMNEAGLVIESLSFPDTKTHKPDARPSISAMQFGQYLLDNYDSVREVIESEKSIRIRPTIIPAGHIFIADKNGNSAVIEFIQGTYQQRISKICRLL
jgi:penicillin V acylase-like amidase (Ntn superfamily)